MFESLSDSQRDIVFNREGRFVVRACPGSGKTYSVAARLAHRLSKWTQPYCGLATLSFTNVAWQEIDRLLNEELGGRSAVQYPHFLGTIDSFINRFIFLPYGHLVLGCRMRPRLVGPPHGVWSGKNLAQALFTELEFDADGNLMLKNAQAVSAEMWRDRRDWIIKAKHDLLAAGFATQGDANYFALCLLERHPAITQMLLRRFSAFVIDEAQDTSAIQMRIIDMLLNAGLRELALVGDPDQAIFEWNEARPELFAEKYNEWRENSVLLNENRRSSQRICDATFPLSSLDEPSVSVSQTRDEPYRPKVVSYQGRSIPQVIGAFLADCAESGIGVTPERVAVLYRSKGLQSAVLGVDDSEFTQPPWNEDIPITQQFMLGRFFLDQQDLRSGMRCVERVLLQVKYGARAWSEDLLYRHRQEGGFVALRKEAAVILRAIPNARGTVGVWVDGANHALASLGVELRLGVKRGHGKRLITEVFSDREIRIAPEGYRLGTVHSAKGETFDAVLMILKKKGVGRYYRTLLADATCSDSEELRIVYVGLTRPRRLLTLAVPDEEDEQAWKTRLLGGGDAFLP